MSEERTNGVDSSAWLGVAFGGGTNSTAMLCGFYERGIRPDIITFADTGSEMPNTYEHLEHMQDVVKKWWGLEILTGRQTFKGEPTSLEECCIRLKTLPSLAYGRKSCSRKFKTQVQDKIRADEMQKHGIKHCRLAMGFDASEYHRLRERPDVEIRKGRTISFWYPLAEWGWNRKDCNDAICRNKITQPGKSACFFCPAKKRGEILHLKKAYPELFERALEIERNAIIKTEGRGLGGQTLRWQDVDKQDEDQVKLWDWLDEQDPYHMPCTCHD